MKKQNSKKGITLIALVITIILMLILAAVVITIAVNGGLFEYAGRAARETEIARDFELHAIDEYVDLIEDMIPIWEGKEESQNGQLVLPVSLNDCAYYYKLQIESEKYTGPAILNVYSIQDGQYFGKITVDNSESYMWKIRNHLNNMILEDGMTNIDFMGQNTEEGNISVLAFNEEELGSTLNVTEIYKKTKRYSLIGNAIIKLKNNQDLTVNDIIPFIDYTLSYGDLGYDLVNTYALANANETIACGIKGSQVAALQLHENKERQLVSSMRTQHKNDVEALEKAIRDNIIVMLQDLAKDARFRNANINTVADYIEENPYLAEYCNKFVGNTIVPFMISYINEVCIPDLNDDGRVSEGIVHDDGSIEMDEGEDTSKNRAIHREFFAKAGDYAGISVRGLADLMSVINKNTNENTTEEDMELLEEVRDFAQQSINNTALYWLAVYQLYQQADLNYFYTMLYNAGIETNIAGIRMGYYQGILPQFSAMMREYGFEFDDSYDFTKDTKYLKQQGLYEHLDEIIELLNSKPVEEPADEP